MEGRKPKPVGIEVVQPRGLAASLRSETSRVDRDVMEWLAIPTRHGDFLGDQEDKVANHNPPKGHYGKEVVSLLAQPLLLRGKCITPSSNGRTADSESANRGSNPWGVAREVGLITPEPD